MLGKMAQQIVKQLSCPPCILQGHTAICVRGRHHVQYVAARSGSAAAGVPHSCSFWEKH